VRSRQAAIINKAAGNAVDNVRRHILMHGGELSYIC